MLDTIFFVYLLTNLNTNLKTKRPMLNEFLSELRQMLPSDRIYTDALRTLGWGTDASFYRQIPKVVIRSDGEEEVSRILALCHKHHLPVTFRAAGTSLSGQSCTDSVLLVAGKHWEKYTLSDDDVITLQPGVVGARVNEILKPHGRVFPPDPASIGSAMVGGIVVNNASGMNCGVHANSDRMMVSAKMVLTDGTVLDTGDEKSRAAFRKSHPEFLKKIEALRDLVRADKDLAERIQKKYSIKNVTGLNLRPLIAYDDPFDIIAHSIVGSEGTLAFLSEVTMKTLKDYPFKASAMVYFMTMKESCEAVVAMKKLKAGDEDFAMSAENLMVKSAEMLDYKSLSSVDDPVFLQYKADVDAGKIEGVEPGDYHNLIRLRRLRSVWDSSSSIYLQSLRRTLQFMANTGPSALASSPAWVAPVLSARHASSKMSPSPSNPSPKQRSNYKNLLPITATTMPASMVTLSKATTTSSSTRALLTNTKWPVMLR